MPDTMTLTKITGALCAALLVFLLTKWFATGIYIGVEHPGAEHVEHERGYKVEVASDEGHGEEAAEEAPSIEELLAAADPAKGEKVFGKCKSCHALEPGVNKTGPTLYGVVGRPVDSVDGFNYSGALEQAADVWTEENLYHFLENPKGFAPGTKMSFAGLKKPGDIANLIAYLKTVGG